MNQNTGWMKVVVCAVLALSAMMSRAQDPTSGSISGTITDATGALVKGATVTVTNTDRNHVERTLTTDSKGYYTATSLPLGGYTVSVTSQGFATEIEKGITLNVGDALTVNEKLKPGSASEVVTVTDETPQINLQDATQAGLINSTQINELVMVTRNYESLVELQPGVSFAGATDNLQRGPVGVNGASSTVPFAIGGARTTSNNWTIDGADNLDRGANLTLYVYLSPDAISEFKTLRGTYSAAYGRNAAGQVDVVTKSGTNSLHGTAYEYFRNDYLDANPYGNGIVGAKIPKYRYNDFGFSAGGPVYIPKIYDGRNKTFWFVSFDWLREIAYSTTTNALVPTAEERNGDFSNAWYVNATTKAYQQGPINVCTAYTNNPATQSNTCTAAGDKVTNISPLAAQYLKDLYSHIPVPNEQADIAAGLDPHTIINNIPNRYPDLDSVVRIDQQIGQKLNVFYRFAHDNFPDFIGSGTFVSVPIPGISGTLNNNPGTQHMGKMTWAVTPTTVANIGYAYSNGSIYTRPQGYLLGSSSPDVTPSLPYPSTVNLIPTLNFNSYMTTLGGSAVYNDHGVNHQVFGDVTKVHNNHTFIVGISYDHYEKQENNASAGNNQGTFAFTNDAGYTNVTLPTGGSQSATVNESQAFANFLIGNVNNGFSQASKNTAVDINQNIYEAFVQDNWKALPRLSLNLGVRYTFVGAPTDATGAMSNFDPDTYSASKAPTISANGLACFAATCSQVGSNAGQSTTYNAGADYNGVNYLNGLIFGTPAANNNNQASPFGNHATSMQETGFAPRFGFAYDLFGDGKTSFRGGYGWAFDEQEVSYWETTDWSNPPLVVTYSATNASMDNPSGGVLPASCALGTTNATCTTPQRIQAVPLHAALPYVQQYSLDLQQQFTPSLFVDIGYVGSQARHLAGVEEINQPVPNAWRGVVNPNSAGSCLIAGTTIPAFYNSTCDRVLNQIKPYLGWFAIDAMKTIFSSNYNSLQVKATKKYSGKTYVDANFTWSRNLTNSPADYSGFVQNIYNVNGDYGQASSNRKLVLALDAVYEVPWYREQKGLIGHVIGGWELSGIYIAASGLPLTVAGSGGSAVYQQPGFTAVPTPNNPQGLMNDNVGLSVLGNTNAGLRPNQVADPNSGYGKVLHPLKTESANNPWFNTAAFQAQDPLSYSPGTAKRGTILGPGYNKLDVGIFRNFRIYDNVVFQLRGEAFNAINHTNVQTVGTSASSSAFGEITGYRDPRILQIAGRIRF